MEEGQIFFFALLVAFAFGGIGFYIGSNKGRTTLGFWLGFLLGPIGILIIALVSEKAVRGRERKCPYCAEMILMEAKLCRYCGRESEEKNVLQSLAS